ncbi:putative non-specific serine/threonine protein kinase [Helianthus anomalus]
MVTQTTPIVQQPQASTYNHPREDLLDGRRREYLDFGVPLYRASMEGDLEAAKGILQGGEYLVRCSITEKKDTPLHVAAARQSTKFVRYLVDVMNKDDLELQNQDGNTAFCIAAISGNVDMVEIMLEKNQALTTIRGSKNMMPIYLVAFHGNKDMVTKLYNMSNKLTGWTNDEIDEVLLMCIKSDIFDVALRILEDNEELPQDKHAWDVLHVLGRKPDAFHDGPYRHPGPVDKFLASLGLGTKTNIKEADARPLLRFLWKRIVGKPKDVIDGILRGPMIVKDKMETYPSQILFIAAKMNNRGFLVELIGEYPDLVLMRNDDGQTIFHIAVSHRHRKVFSLLDSTGSMKHLITSVRDQQGNNILHLVGKNPEKNAYGNSVTTPFQLFSEHFWYEVHLLCFQSFHRLLSCLYLLKANTISPDKLV